MMSSDWLMKGFFFFFFFFYQFLVFVSYSAMAGVFYIDISCLGGVFAKNTSLETKFPSPFGSGNISSLDWYFSQIYIYIYTPPKHDTSV